MISLVGILVGFKKNTLTLWEKVNYPLRGEGGSKNFIHVHLVS